MKSIKSLNNTKNTKEKFIFGILIFTGLLIILFSLIPYISASETYSNVTWKDINRGYGTSKLVELGAFYKATNGSVVKIPYAKATNLKGQEGNIIISGNINDYGQYTCYTYLSCSGTTCFYSDKSLNPDKLQHVWIKNGNEYEWEDSTWHWDPPDLTIKITYELLYKECNNDNDCDDDNLYTLDKCTFQGTYSSKCTYETIKCINNNDCGQTGFLGENFCSNNDVFKNYQKSQCMNPGTTSSYCNQTTTPTLLIDCGESSCGDYSNNFCIGDNVYKSRLCTDRGCRNLGCFSEFRVEDSLVETCANGCENGACKPECTENSDCPSGKICYNNKCVKVNCTKNSDCGVNGYLNQKFCKNNNVFDKYVTYTCNNPGTSNSMCSSSTEDKQIQACAYGCSNNACTNVTITCNNDNDCNDNNAHTEDKCLNPGTVNSTCQHNNIICLNNSECGTNRYLNQLFCKNGNVFDKYVSYTCTSAGTSCSACTNSTQDKQIQVCTYGCSSGKCLNATTECTVDSDCRRDYYSDDYCNGDDVYHDFHDYSCVNNKCVKSSTSKLAESCDEKCRNGECTDGDKGYNEEDEVIPSDNADKTMDNEAKILTFANSEETNYTQISQSVQKLQSQNAEAKKISSGSFWLILLVILAIILLIILVLIMIFRG